MSYEQLARVFPDGKSVLLASNGRALPRYEEARAEITSRGGVATDAPAPSGSISSPGCSAITIATGGRRRSHSQRWCASRWRAGCGLGGAAAGKSAASADRRDERSAPIEHPSPASPPVCRCRVCKRAGSDRARRTDVVASLAAPSCMTSVRQSRIATWRRERLQRQSRKGPPSRRLAAVAPARARRRRGCSDAAGAPERLARVAALATHDRADANGEPAGRRPTRPPAQARHNELGYNKRRDYRRGHGERRRRRKFAAGARGASSVVITRDKDLAKAPARVLAYAEAGAGPRLRAEAADEDPAEMERTTIAPVRLDHSICRASPAMSPPRAPRRRLSSGRR